MVEMKPSGVQWLGDIPKEWNLAVLGKYVTQVKNKNSALSETNLLSLSYGKIKRKDITANDGLLPASFDGYNIIEEGDIVLRLTDLQNDHTSLRVGRATERGIITSAYVTIRPEKYISSEYLYYVLHSFDIVKGFYGMGAGIRQGLTYDGVQSLKIPSPEISEQQAIAIYLDDRCSKIDEIIAEATASIEEYKELKQAVITEAVTKGLNNNPTVFSGDPNVGDVSEGWHVCKTLYGLAMPITDGPHTTPELYDDGVPFISAEAVSCGQGSIDFDHMRGYISEEFYQECCKKYIPAIDDIYMIKSGATTGRVSMVDADRKFTIWSPLAVFRVNKDRLFPRYLFYFLQSKPYQQQVQLGWTFGTQQNIGMRTLEKLKICLPPLDEQSEIVEYLDARIGDMDTLISEKQALIDDLQAYKKSLIYEVVTGKRRVV